MDEIRISVRRLVEFILREGDIDSGTGRPDRDAMQMGSRLHRKIQGKGGTDYRAEVSLKRSFLFPGGVFDREYLKMPAAKLEDILREKLREEPGNRQADHVPEEQTAGESFSVILEGRADGIIRKKDGYVIDEIKGMLRDVEELEGPYAVHEAQASCYAYLYLRQLKEEAAGKQRKAVGGGAGADKGSPETSENEIQTDSVTVQMTYASLETEQIRRFTREWTYAELEEWFFGLLEQYHRWAYWLVRHREIRQKGLKELEFPFPYREGQRTLAAAVYRTIERGRKLFIQAPTGSGKTIAAVFPALKAIGEGCGQKLFYLTARTVTRTVAEDCFSLLAGSGLDFPVVTITAKEKICPMMRRASDQAREGADENASSPDALSGPACNPVSCPYAKGHFDRVNEAVFDMISTQASFRREDILRQAERFQVCPFEMGLDLTEWADGVICDYNYLFDPSARLQRFFGGESKGEYLFLIDEAHNLVDRGREMYSADLFQEEFRNLKKELKKHHIAGGIIKSLDSCSKWMKKERLNLEQELNVREGLPGESRFSYHFLQDTGTFPLALMNLAARLEEFLKTPRPQEISDPVLALYFRVLSFLDAADRAGEKYVSYSEIMQDGRFRLRIFCVDPSGDLEECLKKGRAAVLFSATLLPVGYYKRLLSTREDDYAVYAASSFDPGRARILIGRDTSSRYTMRGPMEYRKMAEYIRRVVRAKTGNYMVFFSSYRMMEDVAACFAEICPENFRIAVQNSRMSEEDREEFLRQFAADPQGEKDSAGGLVGFCVMGSFFGEGIDLRHDRLIGAVIVGTGLPQICAEREILQGYCSGHGLDGFHYAYICPGMNKVLQAAGRVIRTEEDAGVIVLLDERFGRQEYRGMFPREWKDSSFCTVDSVEEDLRAFWKRISEKGEENGQESRPLQGK